MTLERFTSTVISEYSVNVISTDCVSIRQIMELLNQFQKFSWEVHMFAAGGEALILVLDTRLNWQSCREF